MLLKKFIFISLILFSTNLFSQTNSTDAGKIKNEKKEKQSSDITKQNQDSIKKTLQENINEATWDQGIPYFPESQTVTEMIDKLDLNSILNGKKLTIEEVKLCREIGIAFYNRGMTEAAEWYLDKTKGYVDILELDVEKDVHHICDELKKQEEKEQEIPKEAQESIKKDLNFLQQIPTKLEKLSKADLQNIAKEIDNKIKNLIAEKDSLVKAKAKQEIIDAKDGTIKTLSKEKEVIDLTINNGQLKVDKDVLKSENKDLASERASLRKWLTTSAIGLVLLLLAMVVIIQRKTIKVQDTEIDEQLKDIAKKNTYLEHAARIIRHDMHSGINTYIPRGLSSLEKRITPEELQTLKIDGSIKLIKEGLNHTQKVYKSVYEFTNLVKQDVVLSKTKVNIGDLLRNYFSSTSYSSQVEVSELIEIEVNETLFCNAIDNLVKNGLKYNESEVKFVKIFMENNNLIIQDNGVGLTQQQFEKISFNYISKKTKDIDKETSGLGLNICQAIMTEHGYNLRCEKNDIGTKISIDIS